MGLDMYLSRRHYVGPNEDTEMAITGVEAPINPKRVATIVEEVGYWRKANAIHQWFVANVQDGNDDCGSYFVSMEQLEQLMRTVETVLASCELVDGTIHNGTKFENGKTSPILEKGKIVKDPSMAKTLLPTTAGFFFGSTEYDQYYVEDLQVTKSILSEAMEEDPSASFYYQSSW